MSDTRQYWRGWDWYVKQNEMKFSIDSVWVTRTGFNNVGDTNLIGWGLEISMTHCTWNTVDGNMDFRKNLPLKDRKQKERENTAC